MDILNMTFFLYICGGSIVIYFADFVRADPEYTTFHTECQCTCPISSLSLQGLAPAVAHNDFPSLYTATKPSTKYENSKDTTTTVTPQITDTFSTVTESQPITKSSHHMTHEQNIATLSKNVKNNSVKKVDLLSTATKTTPTGEESHLGSGDLSEENDSQETRYLVDDDYEGYFEVFENPVGIADDYIRPRRGDMASPGGREKGLLALHDQARPARDNPDDEDSQYGEMMALSSTGETIVVGEKGEKGEPGLQGDPGFDGETGRTGERGEPGAVGLPGMQGLQGIKGDKGDQGLRGFPGAQGPQGYHGPPGPEGGSGRAGTRGSEGPRGMRGEQGVSGPRGFPGSKGSKGEIGQPGPPGIATMQSNPTGTGTVAFQARLGEHLGPSTSKTMVLFNKVEINLGNGFDPSNGSFMAIKDGLYVFHLQVMAMADHIAWLELQVNGQPVAYVWASGYISGTEQMGATITIQQLKLGDIVNVIQKASDDPPNYLYAHYTSLSGYIIG